MYVVSDGELLEGLAGWVGTINNHCQWSSNFNWSRVMLVHNNYNTIGGFKVTPIHQYQLTINNNKNKCLSTEPNKVK